MFRATLSLLLTLALLVASAGRYTLRTPDGRQCPTAPTQVIVETVRSCCGKVVGVVERAPKPGDKAFHQCRCEEKKSSNFESAYAPIALALPPAPVMIPNLGGPGYVRSVPVAPLPYPTASPSPPAPPPPQRA
jgi:hypothetical protein